jgi:hypothetical protein
MVSSSMLVRSAASEPTTSVEYVTRRVSHSAADFTEQ